MKGLTEHIYFLQAKETKTHSSIKALKMGFPVYTACQPIFTEKCHCLPSAGNRGSAAQV